jgi:hypothetical protein
MNIDERTLIYQGIIAYRRYPEDLFVGSTERLQALRSGIFGKQ